MRRSLVGPALAAALAALVAFPWLLGLSYSKGNDFFYWLHFAWLLGPALSEWRLPDWTMLSGCGQPVFNLDHLPDAVALGLLTRWAGLEGGIRLFVVACHALAAAGLYRLSFTLCGRPVSALLAALAYVLSWYFTRTADFYVYTSNLLQLALLPWVLSSYRRAAAGEAPMQLVAGVLTALCITANPQMAIKVVAFCLVWLLVEGRNQPRAWRRLLTGVAVVGVVAAWLSVFHIAAALIHRQETYTFGGRGSIGPRDWQVFVALPMYAFDMLRAKLGLGAVFGVPNAKALDSHYEGVGVLVLALAALRFGGAGSRRLAVGLWGGAAAVVLLFFAVSWGRASEWVGTPRNMLFLLSFCLALLVGCGHASLLERRTGGRLWFWKWGVPALVLLELVGMKGAFYLLGPHHLSLSQIPHLAFWRQVSAQQEWGPGERFFTFKSDLAFMLFPATTGRPTANLVHQRDYAAEYFSYQDALNKYFVPTGPYQLRVSEYLGLLGVRYVDLPRNGFVGRYAKHQQEVLAHFDADPHLRELARRSPGEADEQWQRARLDGQGTEQVFYENRRARPVWVAGNTVALIGNTRAGEKQFEEIALGPNFAFDRTLFLLCERAADLQGLEAAVQGVVPVDPEVELPASLPVLDPGQLAAGGQSDAGVVAAAGVGVERWEEERIELAITPATGPRFVAVALQRFSDWYASAGDGRALPAFKTGAGLTGVYLPPGVDRVVLEYRRPPYKSWWRWFSLAGLLLVGLGLAAQWRTRARGRARWS